MTFEKHTQGLTTQLTLEQQVFFNFMDTKIDNIPK